MNYSNPPQGQENYYESQQDKLQLTPEEVKVLQDCAREGVYARALPLGIAFGLGGLFGARAGPLMHAKFGAKPAVIGLGLIGYFIGRLSYTKVCVQKVLTEVPGGNLKRLLEQRPDRRGEAANREYVEAPRTSPQYYATVDPSKTQEQTWTDQRPMANFDVPAISNLDAYSSDYEHESPDERKEETARIYKSYDDLRKQNREEYMNKNQGYQQVPIVRRRAPQETPSSDLSGGQKTKYGDTWDA